MAQQTADQLVRIAHYHGFDGWLINIECELHPAKIYIPHLLHFLAHLRARTREVCGGHSAVIWYDAVTTEGRLRWQNALTPLNYPFLDASDGLFLNYHWKSGTPAEVAAVAGSRACDVYMGVDVHGRGTFGGGQMMCDIALLTARMSGVSAAIFGPGWVHENFPDASEEEREDISETFWRRVVEAWGPRPVPYSNAPMSLPFITSFCEAKGRCHWIQGRCVSATPWHNLATLDLQPALLLPPSREATDGSGAASPPSSPPDLVLRKAWLALDALREGNTTLLHSTSHSPHTASHSSGSGGNGAYKEGSVSLLRDLAFHGATCLLVQPPSSPSPTAPPMVHPLYHTHILVPPTGLSLNYALTHPPSTPHEADQPSSWPPAPSSLPHGLKGAAEGNPSTSPDTPALAPLASAPPASAPPALAPEPAAVPAPHREGPADPTHPNLAIALWLAPTAASPADAAPCIVAILPPSGFATSFTEALQAAGLRCVHAHQVDGAIPGSSSSNSSKSTNVLDLSQSCDGIHQVLVLAGAEPWRLVQLQVEASALPCEGAAIVGVGIACVSAVHGAAFTPEVPDPALTPTGGGSAAASEDPSGGGAAVCLGHLALAAPCIPCRPAPSPCLRSGLRATNITTLGLSPDETLLSCDVCWQRELGLSSTAACALEPLFSRHHVWARGNNVHGSSPWLWLGTAHTELFHCAVVVSGSSDGSSDGGGGQLHTSMRVCRPRGHALRMLEGKVPAAGVGPWAWSQEDAQPQSVDIAVQPVRAVDGLVAGPVECCSQLRISLAHGSREL
ncbi:glycosyl hydrolase family 85-domain-containing protein [Dunaliella salina]|uniref:Glycosyl hydrolase family 85-domain-containing protein n=1 Tax=Dunaliella salina TaxID=3046 RepID=A0ABQ7GKT5_DUNSA|nr:glycosyl hydrolase family 85-domain-containing protein [Dunaliella salina]|eukprot:KAF5835216.1 glycosyl hydrolase family 85-domain-containing protein [Dunaliella salina]